MVKRTNVKIRLLIILGVLLLSSSGLICLPKDIAMAARPENTTSAKNQKKTKTKETPPAPVIDNSILMKLNNDNLKLNIQLEAALKQVEIEKGENKKLAKRIEALNKKIFLTTETYIVDKNDSLWKIAAKKEVYNDPYKWLLLYHANKDMIYDPDIIYPNTVLVILRTPGMEKLESDK
jgi:nucleoid-associated protein YgaU